MFKDIFVDQTSGPKTNNMGPPTSKLETGGLDYLVFQVFGSFEKFDKLREVLSLGKEDAQVGGLTAGLVHFGGLDFKVLPHGSGRFLNAAKFMFKYEGITYAIMDRPNSSEGKPIMRVEVSSMPFMTMGHRGVVEAIRRVLGALGCVYESSKCMRVDLCADIVGVPVGLFVGKWMQNHVVREQRKWSMHGDGGANDVETLQIGTGDSPVKLRFYDKVKEVENDEIKAEVFHTNRTGGEMVCTRVEFELRRSSIRETFALDSVEDVLTNIDRIVSRLTNGWFRFTTGFVDRQNTSRSEVWDVWELVKQKFAAWINSFPTVQAKKPLRAKISKKKRATVVRGYWASMMAGEGFMPSSMDEAFLWLREAVSCRFSELRKLVNDKALKLADRNAIEVEAFFENKGIRGAGPLFQWRGAG